jgi:hypothetical protein
MPSDLEDKGRPIDQMQMIALAECHDPPPFLMSLAGLCPFGHAAIRQTR